MGKVKDGMRPLSSPRSWARTVGGLIAGQAVIDGADHVAALMETRWGAGRLRLLVSAELRERFDRQRYLFNQAIWYGQLVDVQREASRMIVAWQALDKAAAAVGAAMLSPQVWEVALEDGTVAAIVRDGSEVRAVAREGRQVAVYSLDEIARMLTNYRAVTEVKLKFPGAAVTAIRRTIEDPLDAVRDTELGFDDEMQNSGDLN